MGREQGATHEQLHDLASYAASAHFSPAEKSVLAYADAITQANSVPDAVFDDVRAHFSADAVVALTAAICWELCASKFNRALDIGAQGVCLITTPER